MIRWNGRTMRDGDEGFWRSFWRREGSIKERSEGAYAFTNFVMNYVQWILAIGLGYYVLNKYSEIVALNATVVMLTILIYPVLTDLVASVMATFGSWSHAVTHIWVLVLSVVCAYFAAVPFAGVVRFIAKSQGCS